MSRNAAEWLQQAVPVLAFAAGRRVDHRAGIWQRFELELVVQQARDLLETAGAAAAVEPDVIDVLVTTFMDLRKGRTEEGTVVEDAKYFGIEIASYEQAVRERTPLYAKKLLWRVLGKDKKDK